MNKHIETVFVQLNISLNYDHQPRARAFDVWIKEGNVEVVSVVRWLPLIAIEFGMLEAKISKCFWLPPKHGFPSLTKTGTATRRGDWRLTALMFWWWWWWWSIPFSCAARLVLYRWFWNQILTCVGDKRMSDARCSRSGADKYRCWRNRRSSSKVCAFENKTLRLRFLLIAELLLPSPVCELIVWSSSSSISIISSPSSSMSTSWSFSSLSEAYDSDFVWWLSEWWWFLLTSKSWFCCCWWWWSCCWSCWKYFRFFSSTVCCLERFPYDSSVSSVIGDVLSVGLVCWWWWKTVKRRRREGKNK